MVPRRKIENCAPGCPVEAALSIIDGKWKGVILYHLLNEHIMRFGQLLKRFPGLTQRMLTKQLRELEQDGLIQRKVWAQVPPKVEYSLKEKGLSLRKSLEALAEWGRANAWEESPAAMVEQVSE